MRLSLEGNWGATVTEAPLRHVPRFDFRDFCVRIGPYADVREWDRFLSDTFGSGPRLWDTPDELRFSRHNRDLVGISLQLAFEAAEPEECARVQTMPHVRPGGLHADEARDCRLEASPVLCRAPGDGELTCLRDLDVLDEPLTARIGVAPDVALLVQRGTVIGWSLTDPVRYLTTGFAAPDPAPPAPATRTLLTACLDLFTTSLIDEVRDCDPAALLRLLALDEALRDQREDRHRTDALHSLIADLVEDYADRPTGQRP